MEPWHVFYSYSHLDSELRETLAKYLAPLRENKTIKEWHDRKIEPGTNWEAEISAQLDSAHLILLLISADYLASDYCFGVEVEKALIRLKREEVKVAPILLRPCLWNQSRFSELQIIPRSAKAVTQWASEDEAFFEVAKEIAELVAKPPPSPAPAPTLRHDSQLFASSLGLVRNQVLSYARLYERTRQLMPRSDDRTRRYEQIFQNMRALATASYPLLDELHKSPSPGERLAAVAILQVFADPEYLSFLVSLVGSDRAFVGYHAAKALHFAVGSLDANSYPKLMDAIHEAQVRLRSASIGFDTDRRQRQKVLRTAEQELESNIQSLSVPSS